jgi:hypothetical protein
MADPHPLRDPKDRPAIDLTVERVACPLHGEVFRATWPKGWLPFSMGLMQEVLNGPLAQQCGGDVRRINAALDAKPCCERVPVETIERLYGECGVGVDRVCELCNAFGLGTPFAAMHRTRGLVRFKHVCFSCVLRRFTRDYLN